MMLCCKRPCCRRFLPRPQVAPPFCVGYANCMSTVAYLCKQRQFPKPRMVTQMSGIVPGLDKGCAAPRNYTVGCAAASQTSLLAAACRALSHASLPSHSLTPPAFPPSLVSQRLQVVF